MYKYRLHDDKTIVYVKQRSEEINSLLLFKDSLYNEELLHHFKK